jgi:hypothetical protein
VSASPLTEPVAEPNCTIHVSLGRYIEQSQCVAYATADLWPISVWEAPNLGRTFHDFGVPTFGGAFHFWLVTDSLINATSGCCSKGLNAAGTAIDGGESYFGTRPSATTDDAKVPHL